MSRAASWVPPSRSPTSAGRSSAATDRERPGGDPLGTLKSSLEPGQAYDSLCFDSN